MDVFSIFYEIKVCCVCIDEAILMSIYNIHFPYQKGENPKVSLNFVSLSRPKNFLGAQKRAKINHGKMIHRCSSN